MGLITQMAATGPVEVYTDSEDVVTLRVSIEIQTRRWHKQVISPQSVDAVPSTLSLTPIQLALVQGFRWLRALEADSGKTMKDLATAERTDPSKVSRTVNLTALNPKTIAAILEDTLPTGTTLLRIAITPPLLWSGVATKDCR